MSASSSEPSVEALLADRRVVAAADVLAAAETSRTPCPPVLATIEALGAPGAYAVQETTTRAAEAAGRRSVGRKIGLTSRTVQAQLGVDQPDYGMLFDDMEYGDEAEIAFDRVLQPRIEAEVAFVLGRDLDEARPTLASVMRAVDYAVPALEIVGSRIADWKISLLDTIADNASSGVFALGGTARKLDGLDLRLCGATLEENGEPSSFGCGAACLGHPLNAVAWLARAMSAVGRPLREGDVVLSGALGPMIPVRPGASYEARISGLGRVAVHFSEG